MLKVGDVFVWPARTLLEQKKRVYIIPCHKIVLFVFVQNIAICYKVRIIFGVTHFHGKQIVLFVRMLYAWESGTSAPAHYQR